MSENETKAEEKAKDDKKDDNAVSPWPSLDEALGMAKKLCKDTTASVTEIYKEYKAKRDTGDKKPAAKANDDTDSKE